MRLAASASSAAAITPFSSITAPSRRRAGEQSEQGSRGAEGKSPLPPCSSAPPPPLPLCSHFIVPFSSGRINRIYPGAIGSGSQVFSAATGGDPFFVKFVAVFY